MERSGYSMTIAMAFMILVLLVNYIRAIGKSKFINSGVPQGTFDILKVL